MQHVPTNEPERVVDSAADEPTEFSSPQSTSMRISHHQAGTVLVVHPLARLFPMISGSAQDEFVRDIAENGLREPITVIGDQILDGANRYRACRDLGLPFATQEWDRCGSEIDFVMRKNLHRRQLSESQRAAVAAELAKHLATDQRRSQNKDDAADSVSDLSPQPSGRLRDQVAKQMNVSSGLVGAAQRVLNKAVPDLVEMVRNDEVAVSAAADVAGLSADEQTQIVKGGPAAVREASKKQRTAKEARKSRSTPTAIIVSAGAESAGSELNEASRSSDESAADENESVDERFLADLQFETGIPDSPLFAVDAHAARRVQAMLEVELKTAREDLLARNLSPELSIVVGELSHVLDRLNCSKWCLCPSEQPHDLAGNSCSECRGRGYLVAARAEASANAGGESSAEVETTLPALQTVPGSPPTRRKRSRADNVAVTPACV